MKVMPGKGSLKCRRHQPKSLFSKSADSWLDAPVYKQILGLEEFKTANFQGFSVVPEGLLPERNNGGRLLKSWRKLGPEP